MLYILFYIFTTSITDKLKFCNVQGWSGEWH